MGVKVGSGVGVLVGVAEGTGVAAAVGAAVGAGVQAARMVMIRIRDKMRRVVFIGFPLCGRWYGNFFYYTPSLPGCAPIDKPLCPVIICAGSRKGADEKLQ